MSTRRTCDMTTGAQGALAAPNIRDWGCEPARAPDEDAAVWDIYVDFYAGTLDNPTRFLITVSNTVSGRIVRNPSPTGLGDLVMVSGTVATPTGFTAAIDGWRSGGNKRNRQKGLADALLAMGAVDSSLGGTTS